MDIVGLEVTEWAEDHVHTIDVWFSQRRNCWVVERLNAEGHLVGFSHCCVDADDARACLDDWLRAHGEAFLASPHRRSDEPAGAKAPGRPRGKRQRASRVPDQGS